MDTNKEQAQKISVGLDIGTTKVCAVAISRDIEEPTKYKIRGVATAKNTGMSKGTIYKMPDARAAVSEAIDKIEKMCEQQVEDVVVGIADVYIESTPDTSVVTINNSENEVKQTDIDRVLNEFRNRKISNDREIIHILPYEYVCDRRGNISDPLGMSCSKLEAKVNIVTGQKNSLNNIRNCINGIPDKNIKIKQIMLEPIASSTALLDEVVKEVGVCLIDIGGGTTDITIFKDKVLRFTSIIALGGDNITDDINAYLNSTKEEAERIKCEYGYAWDPEQMTSKKTFQVNPIGDLVPPRDMDISSLFTKIQPRIAEILRMCRTELENSGFADKLGAGVILTGGASLLKGTMELAKYIFGDERTVVHLRYPINANFIGLTKEIADPKFSTAVGLAIEALKISEREPEEATSEPTNDNDITESDAASSSDEKKMSFFEKAKQWIMDTKDM